MAESIPLYVVDGIATIWDAQAVATAHCAYDISGLRAGTLPGVVQQNAFLGLPMTLMPEEAAHLVKQGAAHLVPLPRVRPPSRAAVAQRTAARVARNRALAYAAWADEDARAAASAAKAQGVGAEKRAARALKRAEVARDKALADGEDAESVRARYEAAVAAATAPPPPVAPRERGTPTSENTNLFAVVPAMPVVDLWEEEGRGEVEVEVEGEGEGDGKTGLGQHAGAGDPASASSSVQYFPRSVRDRALADTFAALNARGLRMGLGPRFGGEWLVYPGDYLRYHAHFTSQVIVRDEPIRPAELVAWGRLGTGTKKAGLLCCWDDGVRKDETVKSTERKDGESDVVFYSLEWANFG
ncbi:tRNA-intron endonuclease catalytic domain-like protein [Cutaneotrichosporon oleaginosum]|uniref:tRNA-splicing endonuclease subunit Sen34 n=1 Tax=Cutaneotrichosporon oleaginosum TaxID=879819 RepID=A0A0J0XYN2_9TREE|nr:tRNA-intron endonuclease catalytic domain-like protein [Cutaneotrichosporon oleaginosum]KLT46167.1 tRNA-intron endonuclease catalytic domain-like protein [Cutaneotrichosporon oleaginosum]TXT10176.1 hypothetical protein COLE_04110 [Cutaneotrichosporon oleaginosum]